MTDVEHRLWIKLRAQKLDFRRQTPLGRYIVDFVSHSAKLVIELDGFQHNETRTQANDDMRTAWLATRGYRVLRFWNGEVIENLDGVVETILHAISPPSLTPPAVPGKGE